MTDKLPHFVVTVFSVIGMLLPAAIKVTPQNFELPIKIIVTEEVLETKTRFTQDLVENKKVLGYKIVRQIDPEVDACSEETVAQEGRDGEKRTYTKIVYYDGSKYSEEIDKTEVTAPKDEIKIRGSKKIYKTLDTPGGQIQYWCKMEKFLATAYDSTCRGCDSVTAIGMRQGFGVIAVDPKVIPLRSTVYVPGYGVAVAGDTGGMINGKHIDLGYDSLMGQWSRGYVDVYLL